MLKLENIEKSFKKTVFAKATLEANAGEIVLLMGKSGIGKSTLLDIIAGVKTVDSGRYFFKDEEIFPEDDKQMSRFRNQNIGYILQDFALIDDYTVLENLTLPALYQSKMDMPFAKERAKHLAKYFDITDILDQKVRKISGGQKQRASIARSLLLNPSIILADEPTSNLDRDNFDLVVDLFLKQRERGKVLIIATHDERLLEIADKVYHITDCKLMLDNQ
jgi:ABC-type lipoprotein export system ATPase subunit